MAALGRFPPSLSKSRHLGRQFLTSAAESLTGPSTRHPAASDPCIGPSVPLAWINTIVPSLIPLALALLILILRKATRMIFLKQTSNLPILPVIFHCSPPSWSPQSSACFIRSPAGPTPAYISGHIVSCCSPRQGPGHLAPLEWTAPSAWNIATSTGGLQLSLHLDLSSSGRPFLPSPD